MKQKFISIILILLLFISGCSQKTNLPSKKPTAVIREKNLYNISVELDSAKKILKGREHIVYVNNESINLNNIYLHIYPNAYKKLETIPVPPEDYSSAFLSNFKPGYIDIIDISASDENLKYSIEGKDKTILNVSLNLPLKPKENIDIYLEFSITLPEIMDRLGYAEGTFNFGNWYPIAAVYDNSGWNLDPYYSMGDPFYSDVSDYLVKITVPRDYKVASTGEMISETAIPKKKVYIFKENSVRDFAWVASNGFEIDTKNVDGVIVKSYSINSPKYKRDAAMAAAENSIKIFNKAFGKYPYKTYSVAATNFISGMEYPGIVFINKEYYSKNGDDFYLDVTIAHETAHQWWYGVVGNDEVEEAWVDESLTSYSEVVYYEKLLGVGRGQEYFENEFSRVYNSYKGSFSNGETILRPVYDFKTSNDYALLVYYKGAVMLNELRNKVGDEAFYNIMKTYYEGYKFKNATTQDFIHVVENVTEKDWDSFFNKWLLEK